MSASPYDAPLSAIRSHVENTAVWLAIWEARNEPDAHARRCANDAIDGALAGLHKIRQLLISEIRVSDDKTAARVDAMLAELHRLRTRLISDIRASDDAAAVRADKLLAGLDSSGPAGPAENEGRALERPARGKGNTDE